MITYDYFAAKWIVIPDNSSKSITDQLINYAILLEGKYVKRIRPTPSCLSTLPPGAVLLQYKSEKKKLHFRENFYTITFS